MVTLGKLLGLGEFLQGEAQGLSHKLLTPMQHANGVYLFKICTL